MIKRIDPKKISEIGNEWDMMSASRQAVIESGKDISLELVTAPSILRQVKKEGPETLIDVGCGTGFLTAKLAGLVSSCVGIDASGRSIEIAKKKYSKTKAHFYKYRISEYVTDIPFDMCVANMVFSSDPELSCSLQAIHNMLNVKGKLLVVIPHPCFWAKYWNFETEEWFDYGKEIFVEHDFSVSLVKSLGKATYIHRPLQQYINEITSNGFQLKELEELEPVGPLPAGYRYDYPRFLFMEFQKS